MATIQPPPNSVWPNGLQTDSEDYVNFYQLGTNKVDISTIAWPEGDAVISPFVYQDDKLVGFVDTKALEIDNNNTTIDINYTHFDADLDSIMENTLTINAPANAVVNVKYGAVDKVLTEKIEKLIGMGKCEVKFDKNNNKATIAVALDTSEEQFADIENLLERVLPSNITTEMAWMGGLPFDYTPLKYLEGGQNQNIDSGVIPTDETRIEAVLSTTNNNYGGTYFCATHDSRFGASLSVNTYVLWGKSTPNIGDLSLNVNIKTFILLQRGYIVAGAKSKTFECESLTDYPTSNTVILNLNKIQGDSSAINKWYSCQIFAADAIVRNFIPALNPEGQPGMYDTVSKVFKTNSGTGDFIYPDAEQVVQTTDINGKFYAKLTEHGVRRLYHVPKGYNGTKDEYAAANGFKELVEPPAPLEGYWAPQWRETETQLILDWVETEPPVEEEILNNEN